MLKKYDTVPEKEQEVGQLSQYLTQELETFFAPFLLMLVNVLDKRLVRTCLESLVALMRFRNNKQGLLLSELGSYMDMYLGHAKTATAGTKRLGKFIRSKKWGSSLIDTHILEQAEQEVEKLQKLKKRVLCLWDGSVIEKPESTKLEGLCPVISSKAKRLRKTRKGIVFNTPGGKPVMVAGMQWFSGLITGMDGPVCVAFMDWWTTKGKYAIKQRGEEKKIVTKAIGKWGETLIHVFDRGYASGLWLEFLQEAEARFVIRWIKTHFFLDLTGREKKLWQFGQGKKYCYHQVISDHNGQKRNCSVWWTEVRHADYALPLYLVKVRVDKSIWRLITNEPILTEEQAWTTFFTYRRRWKIEMSFRYGKSELAMESPRLWSWENRLKLLGLVTLLYTFLLFLLNPFYSETIKLLFQFKCHRTGKRCQDALAPLYRLRWALSRLWDDAHPLLGRLFPPNLDTLRVFASFGTLDGFPKNQG
jgi:DDE family transposase